jgi:hypothetical protein
MRKAGWHFRSKIIWEKPDANPETANDRPSRSHEDVFLFTKTPNYLYDAFAIREAGSPLSADGGANGRNARTVWRISKKSTKFAHFATFPPALPEKIIRAGTSHRGQCEKCGKPWTRIVKKDRYPTRPGADTKTEGKPGGVTGNRDPQRHVTAYTTEGWKAGCQCGEQFVVPDAVLDPFAGTGTTMSVALNLGRVAYGIELVPEYAAEIVRRLEGGPSLFGASVEQVIVKPRRSRPQPRKRKVGTRMEDKAVREGGSGSLLPTDPCPKPVSIPPRPLMEATRFMLAVATELGRARSAWPTPIRGPSEALGVIREEYVEFEQEVFGKEGKRNIPALLEELIQIAAMCARTAEDLGYTNLLGGTNEAFYRAVRHFCAADGKSVGTVRGGHICDAQTWPYLRPDLLLDKPAIEALEKLHRHQGGRYVDPPAV